MDNSKYNLRCNPIVSEKMLKKDFIYTIKKLPGERSLPFQICSTKENTRLLNDERKTLEFKCNYCYEPVATLMSLSTHVKSHSKNYCRICYWIFMDDETVDEHMKHKHQVTCSNYEA